MIISFVLKFSISDHITVAIQYGYSTLFVAALPAGPAFAFLYNVIENYFDSYSFLFLYQRVTPKSLDSIGVW